MKTCKNEAKLSYEEKSTLIILNMNFREQITVC